MFAVTESISGKGMKLKLSEMSGKERGEHGPSDPIMETNYYVECISLDCGWEGMHSDTVRRDGIDACPKCGYCTDPAQDRER